VHGVLFEPSTGRYTVFAPTPATPATDPADPGKPLRVAFTGSGEFRGVTLASASFGTTPGIQFDYFGVPLDTTGAELAAPGRVVLSCQGQSDTIEVSPNTGKGDGAMSGSRRSWNGSAGFTASGGDPDHRHRGRRAASAQHALRQHLHPLGDAQAASVAAQLAEAKMEEIAADKNAPSRGFSYLVASNYPAETPVAAFPGTAGRSRSPPTRSTTGHVPHGERDRDGAQHLTGDPDDMVHGY